MWFRISGAVLCVTWIGMLSVVVFSCTTTKEKKASPEEIERQKKIEEFQAELEIGRNMAGRLLQFYGTQENVQLLEYVNRVGSYLAGYSSYPDRRYMFEIIDSEIVNAFACPGGYIMVTAGSIKHAKNEAELAGVLAHEIAHVGHRHMFDRLRNMSKEDMDKANEIANKELRENPILKARQRPEPEESAFGDLVAKYLSAGSGGLSILKAAGAGMAVMLEQGLGAEKEYAADGLGTRTYVSAGYDPGSFSQFLCRLKNKSSKKDCKIKAKKKKKSEPKTILAKTHPAVEDRIVNIEKVLKELNSDEIIGAKGARRYRKYRRKLAKK